jgi:hypothetical protein
MQTRTQTVPELCDPGAVTDGGQSRAPGTHWLVAQFGQGQNVWWKASKWKKNHCPEVRAHSVGDLSHATSMKRNLCQLTGKIIRVAWWKQRCRKHISSNTKQNWLHKLCKVWLAEITDWGIQTEIDQTYRGNLKALQISIPKRLFQVIRILVDSKKH